MEQFIFVGLIPLRLNKKFTGLSLSWRQPRWLACPLSISSHSVLIFIYLLLWVLLLILGINVSNFFRFLVGYPLFSPSVVSFLDRASPRFPLRSHSLVCIENHLFIVGIGPILNEEIKFIYWSDRSDRTCIYS